MLVVLKQRFSERRNKDIVSLMKYLHGSNISRDESYEDFSYFTKPAAILLAKYLIKRLFSPPMNNDSPATIPDFLESTPTPTTSSLAMILRSSIEFVSSVCPTTRPDTFTEPQKEFKLFDATGTRTPKLEKLLQALLTIPSTSTCSERVFSVAAGVSTKIRNRLAYIILNAL
jgi:hypothetical protein